MESPFCDFLKITTPLDNEYRLRSELSLFLCQILNVTLTSDGYFSFPFGGGISMRSYTGVKVFGVSVTGKAIETMRSQGIWENFLALISEFPHRVTGIDATLDYYDVDSPSILKRLYNEGSNGLHRLTRKSISSSKITKIFSTDMLNRETGTVYFQTRKSEVHAKVYDKRHEVNSNGGLLVREVLRYELTVTGKMGPTLRDAFNPTSMFWHYMGETLLKRPDNIEPWVGFSEGFVLEKSVELLPYQQLVRQIETSCELHRIVELAAMSGQVGSSRLINDLTQLLKVAIARQGEVEKTSNIAS
jgi:hypothetical protein